MRSQRITHKARACGLIVLAGRYFAREEGEESAGWFRLRCWKWEGNRAHGSRRVMFDRLGRAHGQFPTPNLRISYPTDKRRVRSVRMNSMSSRAIPRLRDEYANSPGPGMSHPRPERLGRVARIVRGDQY